MLRPEEDFETWVLYLTEFLVENDLYIQMFNDFERILQYYDENEKLPDPIEGYSFLFVNVSGNLIVQNITELEIPDNQQFKEILQILSNVGVYMISLFAKGYEKFEESIRYIFSRKTPIYNSTRKNPNTNQILFCNVIKNFLQNDGLTPLFQVVESYAKSDNYDPSNQVDNPLKNVSDLTPTSSNPANSSNSIINKVCLLSQLVQTFQFYKTLNNMTTIKMINRILPTFSSILRRFDKAKLRNTDSNGINSLVKELIRFSNEINVQINDRNDEEETLEVDITDLFPIDDVNVIIPIVSHNFKVVINDVLNFSIFSLKSDILEKQMLAANILKMLRSYPALSHYLQEWSIKNQTVYFSVILEQKFNENVLAVLKSPYKMFIEFAPPTIEQLNTLWNMTIKLNPSSSSYFNSQNNNNNSNSFSYSNFQNSSGGGLNSPNNSGSGTFSNPQQIERETFISFILNAFKSIGDERTNKFLDDILIVNNLITRNVIDVLQIIASKSDTLISERIAHFIIDLLKDSSYQDLAFSSIKEMTKDKGQSSMSIKQLLMNYCRSQLIDNNNDVAITRSLLEIMQCLIHNSYQKSKDVDEDLINLVLSFLDDSKIDSYLIFDFVRTCCVRAFYNLTHEQFDKLWKHANSSNFAYLSNIVMKQGINFLSDEKVEESIKEKLNNYDYSKSELNFVDFVSYFIFNLNKSKGIIYEQPSNERNKFPTNFYIKLLTNETTLDGFEYLIRILTECRDKMTATVTTTRIITFVAKMPNQSQAACFLLKNFLSILKKDGNQLLLEVSKTRICNLLYEYIAIEEENLLCLEDFNLRGHKLPSIKNKIRITIQSQQLNIYVKPSIKVEHLCMKVALRMGCKNNNVCLIYNGRELKRFWALRDYGIRSNCIMEVYLKSPQQLQQQFEYNSYFQNQAAGIYGNYSYQNELQQQLKSFQQPVPTVDILASHTLYNCGLTNLLLDILREYNTDIINNDIHSDVENVKMKAKQASELVTSVWRLLNILETDSNALEAASDPSSASVLLSDSKTPLELLYNIQCIVISIHNCTFGTSDDNEDENDNEDDKNRNDNNNNKIDRYHFRGNRNRNRNLLKYDDEEEDEEEEEGFDEEFDEIETKPQNNKNNINNNNKSKMIYSSSSSSSSSSLNSDSKLYVTDEIISLLLDGKIYDIGLNDAYMIILISLKKLIYHRIIKQSKLNQNDQIIQNIQNQQKKFKLKLKSRFLKQNEMAVKLVNNILTKLEVAKSRDFKQTAVRLLHDLASFYPEETCHELFSENSKLSSFILKLDPDTLVLLSHIFQALHDKPRIFSFLSTFLFSVDEKLCENFCKVICETITIECQTEGLTKELCKRLKINRNNNNDIDVDSLVKNPFLEGYCLILDKIFGLQKSADILPNVDVLDSLVYYFVEDCDEVTQESILSIFRSFLAIVPDAEKRISELLLPYLSIDSKQWNFDPRRYEKTSIYTGLKNLGATCYLNSVLQQLFMNKTFRSKFMNIQINEKSEKNENWILCLQKLFARLQFSKMPFLSTLDFCNNFIFHDNMTINTREQQDASEFFQALLDKLPKEVSSCFTGKIVNIIQSDPDSETVNLENGEKIQFRKENFESFFLLTLEVKGYKNLEKSIQKYLEGEDLQYTVEEYNRKIDVKHYTRIEEAPEFFVIQLKRFEYDVRTWNRYKVNDEFEFPFVLNIHSLMNKDTTGSNIETNTKINSNDDDTESNVNINIENDSNSNSNVDDYNYELTGIVIHDGHVEGGHYYSFIKTSLPCGSSASANTSVKSHTDPEAFFTSFNDEEDVIEYDDDEDDEFFSKRRDKGNDSRWYSFNDNLVEEISLEDLKVLSFGSSKFQSQNSFSPSAYILFYSKMKKPKEQKEQENKQEQNEQNDLENKIEQNDLENKIEQNDLENKKDLENMKVDDLKAVDDDAGFSIDPDFMKVIEDENKLFNHNQCVFRSPVMNLIATQIKDWRVILSFLLNVAIHSKQVDYSNYIFENFINILKSPPEELQYQIQSCEEDEEFEILSKQAKDNIAQKQHDALQIILSQKENVKEAIFQCSTDQILKHFVIVLNRLIQVNDPEMSRDFILYLTNSLKEILPVWKQIPYIALLIAQYSIQNKHDCTRPFCELLVNFYKLSSYNYIIKFSNNNNNNNNGSNVNIDHLAPIKEVDLNLVFKTLIFLFDDFVTKDEFLKVFDVYDAIFKSHVNSSLFLAFCEKAIEHDYISFDEFLEMIFRNNEVECNVIAKSVVIANDSKLLCQKLSLFRSKISNFDLLLSKILLRNLLFDDSLRYKCIEFATVTVFYLIVSESSRIRNNAEFCILGLFPDVSPLEFYEKAENLSDVPEKFQNDVYDQYFDLSNKYDIIPEDLKESFFDFIKQVATFCATIAENIKKENDQIVIEIHDHFRIEINEKQSSFVFTNFIRVITWIYARTKTRDPNLLRSVWFFFVSITNCGLMYGCNRFELVRLFQTMQLCIPRLDEEKMNELVNAIFPITFAQDKKLHMETFIIVFEFIGKDVDLFIKFDSFKQTLMNFFRLNDRLENVNKGTTKIAEFMNISKNFMNLAIETASHIILSSIEKVSWQSVNIALFSPHLSNLLFARIISFLHRQIFNNISQESITNPSTQVFYTRTVNDMLMQIMKPLNYVIMKKLQNSKIYVEDSEINNIDDDDDKISQSTFRQIKDIVLNNASKFAMMRNCVRWNRELIVSFCNYLRDLNQIEKSFNEEEDTSKSEKDVKNIDSFTNEILDRLFSLQIPNNLAVEHFLTVAQLSDDVPILLEMIHKILSSNTIQVNNMKSAFEALEKKLSKKANNNNNYFAENENEVVKFIYNVISNVDKIDNHIISFLNYTFKNFSGEKIGQVFALFYRKYSQIIQSMNNNGNKNRNKNNLPDEEVDMCEDEDEDDGFNEPKSDEEIVSFIRILADILIAFPDQKKKLLDLVHFNPSVMESWPEAAEEYIPLFLSNE